MWYLNFVHIPLHLITILQSLSALVRDSKNCSNIIKEDLGTDPSPSNFAPSCLIVDICTCLDNSEGFEVGVVLVPEVSSIKYLSVKPFN